MTLHNALAQKYFGKYWFELTDEERLELKRKPEWIGLVYSNDFNSLTELFNYESKH